MYFFLSDWIFSGGSEGANAGFNYDAAAGSDFDFVITPFLLCFHAFIFDFRVNSVANGLLGRAMDGIVQAEGLTLGKKVFESIATQSNGVSFCLPLSLLKQSQEIFGVR